MARRNIKKKKKSNSSLSLILIAAVVIISFIFFSNSGNTMSGNYFAKSKTQSKNKKSIPPELRWEKAFRFSSDKEEKSSANFLQRQAEQNRNKNKH